MISFSVDPARKFDIFTIFPFCQFWTSMSSIFIQSDSLYKNLYVWFEEWNKTLIGSLPANQCEWYWKPDYNTKKTGGRVSYTEVNSNPLNIRRLREREWWTPIIDAIKKMDFYPLRVLRALRIEDLLFCPFYPGRSWIFSIHPIPHRPVSFFCIYPAWGNNLFHQSW